MKSIKIIYSISFFVLSGCCSSGCFIVSGQAFDELAYPTPYLQKWHKINTTPEKRREDSRSCGSDLLVNAKGPDGIAFSKDRLEKEKINNENENETYVRVHHKWQRCMLGKGYIYMGGCNEKRPQSSPACGAP